MAKKIVIVSTILLLIATPLLNNYLNQGRAVSGLGGECLIALLPSLIYMFCSSVYNCIKIMKEEG